MVEQPFSSDDDLSVLLAALCDGTIDRQSFARLERLLDGDAAARRKYIAYLDLHGELCWNHFAVEHSPVRAAASQDSEIENQNAAIPSPEPSVPRPEPPIPSIVLDLSSTLPPSPGLFAPGGWLFSYAAATVITGMAILGAWASKVSHDTWLATTGNSRGPTAPGEPVPPRPQYVGRITSMADCHWTDPQEELSATAAVSVGRKYALTSGLMEIAYTTGARVVLQGPCAYEVDSASGGFLSLGKLTARVETKGEGGGGKAEIRNQRSEVRGPESPFPLPPSPFIVRTPTALVTDLGTEFGVEVNEHGDVATHVLQGTVEVRVLTDGRPRGPAVRVAANQSVRLRKEADGREPTLLRGAADVAGFVRPGQLPQMARELRLKPFRCWQAFGEELRQRDGLVAYYDFQPDEKDRTVLRNRATTGAALDGRIGDAAWVAGRFPGKYALRFGRPGSGVRVTIPGEYRQMTLVGWVALERLTKLNSLLQSDVWNVPGHVSFLLMPPGVLHLGYCEDWGQGCPVADSPAVLSDDTMGQWRMVAFTVDRAAAEVTFFLDGRPVGKQPLPRPKNAVAIMPGAAMIGDSNGPKDSPEDERSLEGRMDELLIFRTALSTEQILEIYRLGNMLDKSPSTLNRKGEPQ